MIVNFLPIRVIFQFCLFILLLIKLRGLLRTHIIPALKNYRQQADEKRFTLQEQHAILITQKKQLATQFLQQEKQLALLTAKLEKWYLGWLEEQAEKKKEFEARKEKIIVEIRTQDKVVAHRRACRQYTEQTLQQAAGQLQRNPNDSNAQRFFTRTVEKLSSLATTSDDTIDENDTINKEDNAQTDA